MLCAMRSNQIFSDMTTEQTAVFLDELKQQARPVAALAALRPGEPRVLRVRGRQLARRRIVPVGMPDPHHQHEREDAHQQRDRSGF